MTNLKVIVKFKFQVVVYNRYNNSTIISFKHFRKVRTFIKAPSYSSNNVKGKLLAQASEKYYPT